MPVTKRASASNPQAVTSAPRATVPAGSVAGDLIVIGAAFTSSSSDPVLTLANGAVSAYYARVGDTSAWHTVVYKVLTATDITNGYLDYGTLTTARDTMTISVTFYGYDASWLQGAVANTTTSNGSSLASTSITPTEDGAMLFQFAAQGNNNNSYSSSTLTMEQTLDTYTGSATILLGTGPTPADRTGTKTVTYTGGGRIGLYYFWIKSATGTAHSGAASLSGGGTQSAAGIIVKIGALSALGGATLSGAGIRGAIGAGSLSGAGAFSSAGILVLVGGSGLSGAGAFTSEGIRIAVATGSLSGAGTFTSDGIRIAVGASSLSGAGTLAGDGILLLFAVSSLSGDGLLSALGGFNLYGAGSLLGAADLSAVGIGIAISPAVLAGAGDLTAQGIRVGVAGSTLLGAGSLNAAGQAVLVGDVLILGAAQLSALGGHNLYGESLMQGDALLNPPGILIHGLEAILLGHAVLVVAAQGLTLDLTHTLGQGPVYTVKVGQQGMVVFFAEDSQQNIYRIDGSRKPSLLVFGSVSDKPKIIVEVQHGND